MQEPVDVDHTQEPLVVDKSKRSLPVSPELADNCFTCGTCASGCPATGLVPGWDPRKAIRAIALGFEALRFDAQLDEGAPDRLGAVLGDGVVVLIRAPLVGDTTCRVEQLLSRG